jgi:hypothetical protein
VVSVAVDGLYRDQGFTAIGGRGFPSAGKQSFSVPNMRVHWTFVIQGLTLQMCDILSLL